jgi:hypothetical protein
MTFDTNSPATAPYSESFVFNKASVIFDNGVTPSADETFYFDDVNYTPAAATTYVPPAPAVDPTTNAPVPTKAAGNVLPIYSDSYTVSAVSNLNPGWGQATASSDILVSGTNIRKLATLNYQGIELGSGVNVSSYSNLHIDVYSTTTSFNVFIISPGPVEKAVTLTPTNAGWNSFDIPLSQFNGPDKTNIFQLKFEGAPAGTTVYFDNLYFWK